MANRFDGANCFTPDELNQRLWQLQDQVDQIDPGEAAEVFDYTAGAALARLPEAAGVYRFNVLVDGTSVGIDENNQLYAIVEGGGGTTYSAQVPLTLTDTTFGLAYDPTTLEVNGANQLTVIGGGGGGTGDGAQVIHGYLTSDLHVTSANVQVMVTHATTATLVGNTITCINPEDRQYNEAWPGSNYHLFVGNENGYVRATQFQSTWRLDLVQAPYKRPVAP